MKQRCLCCEKEYENAAGFQTKNGFVCMRHEFEDITTFTVSFPGMGDIVFKHKFEADNFIEEDMAESEGKYEEYKTTVGKMNALEFNNLEEWDG